MIVLVLFQIRLFQADEDELSDKFYTEVVSKKFEWGEYGSFEIIVDENFNIVGGRIF